MAGGNSGLIENVSSSVNITSNKPQNIQRVGGIVGHNNGGTVRNCYSTGTISITGKDASPLAAAGGIVGYNSGSQNTVVNCWAGGSVSLTGASGTNGYVGGIVGYGAASNCVARNSGISAPAGMSGGRITGYLFTSSNNYANSGLTVTLGTSQTPTPGLTTKDGANFGGDWTTVGWTAFPGTRLAAEQAIQANPNAWPWWQQTVTTNPKLWFEP